MKIEIACDIDRAGISESEWNRLASGNETNTVFQTYQWFRSWWSVFGAQNRLFLVKAYRGGRLAAIAPLIISRATTDRVLRFAGDEKADYCDFIVRDDKKLTLEKIIASITERRDEWGSIQLKNIPEASSTIGVLAKICDGNGLNLITRQIICPSLVIQGHEEEASMMLKKETFRRRYNYFAKRGSLEFRNIRDEKEALSYLDVFFDQHVRRRAAVGEQSLFMDPRNRDFYVCLTRSLLAREWLLFSVLEFNGRAIAFHFGFDYGSKVIWYKPSFDIEYSKHSPGKVLLKFLLQYSLDNGKHEFDFTLGDEEFKKRFTNKIRRNFQLEFYKTKSRYLYELSKNAVKAAIIKTWQKSK